MDILTEFPELAQWGSVVSIGGVEFWQPDVGRFDAEPASWAPYADGYLYSDPIDGLVWVSEDPWGLITEHYGYWRHHELYGFVWRPFFPPAWRPFVATLVRDGGGAIAYWCPFSEEAWNLGLYVDGYGFDDGYGAPYASVAGADPWFYDDPWGLTYYDPGTYSRDVPDECYRRQRDYRDHRGHREPEPRGRTGFQVVDELPAQRAEPPQAPRAEDRTPHAPPEANPAPGVSIDPVPREILLPKRAPQERPGTRLPAEPRPAPSVPSDRPRTEPVTPTLPAAPPSSLTPARRSPATPTPTPPRREPAPVPSFTPVQRAPALTRESPARPEPAPTPTTSPAPAPSSTPVAPAPARSFTPVFQAPARAAPSPPETVPAPAPPIAPPAPPPVAPAAPPTPPPAPVASSAPAAAARVAPAPAPRALEIRPAALETVRPAAPSSRIEGVRRIDAPKAGKNDVP